MYVICANTYLTAELQPFCLDEWKQHPSLTDTAATSWSHLNSLSFSRKASWVKKDDRQQGTATTPSRSSNTWRRSFWFTATTITSGLPNWSSISSTRCAASGRVLRWLTDSNHFAVNPSETLRYKEADFAAILTKLLNWWFQSETTPPECTATLISVGVFHAEQRPAKGSLILLFYWQTSVWAYSAQALQTEKSVAGSIFRSSKSAHICMAPLTFSACPFFLSLNLPRTCASSSLSSSISSFVASRSRYGQSPHVHHRFFYPLLFPSSCVIPFFLFQCSLCMTRPTWRCTTSASPRSPSFSTAWSSNMSPWRHWRGIRPCIGTMKPSTSRRLYFWHRVCDAPVAFTQHVSPPVDWHQGHSKELPPPLACLPVLDMSGSIRRRHLLLWCLLSFRQHHFHQQWPGESVGELGWWRRDRSAVRCVGCVLLDIQRSVSLKSDIHLCWILMLRFKHYYFFIF